MKAAKWLSCYLAILLFCFPVFQLSSFLVSPSFARECNEGDPQLQEICLQLNKLEAERANLEKATAGVASSLKNLEDRIILIQKNINAANSQLKQLEQNIFKREVDLEVQKKLLAAKVRNLYISSHQFSPFLIFLASANASELTRELFYHQSVADKDKQIIIEIAQELIDLKNDKENLESKKTSLAKLQVDLDTQAAPLRKDLASAQAYGQQLSSEIAALTAKQQSILAEKTGTFQTTVGDVPLADDPASRPDYNPGFSPAFAAFSFGAPHFKGMSQYGAYGRAKNGQNAETILKAYYGGGIEIKKDYSTAININVEGYGAVDIETYTKRIYEVPNSWGDEGGMETLKAQAVAARSYALARTNNGAGSICATESCQVYKPVNKGGNWERAVDETRGWVLVANGQPFSAWYASTSGGYQESYSYNGYSTPGFWDTRCGNQGCWTGEAYEKIAGSPWFYKGWYKNRSGDSCGRSHPWLTEAEMADVLNAWVVLIKHGQSDERVTPSGSCWGGNPYSLDELRARAAGLSVGYSRVTSASVTYANNGITTSVAFQTDKGGETINGLDFKKAFNLRAPGRIALKSGLFNLEKK